MEEKEIYRAATLKFGVKAQMQMVVEECAELIVAINHSNRNRVGIGKVAEECADVEIMLGQMRVLMGGTIDKMKRAKLKRLEHLLEEA